ncbi:methyltransferase domain-containing protein [Streptomyces sp. NBC_00091]|uniref:methyltransferase domain-containing protein n=1 Tax=Streptomyces sp. NBC_00091 TaxID=2975648 RepID=UPI00224FB404|nr:methyltransferase domain-containing protein [Streptomyces sp. NBC_00091]MCX5381497.1 methyltransferase domain-containing protein [Streptomyces sp. NBC_00091]
MSVVVVQHASAETPPTVRRLLASAGLSTRTVLLTDGADPSPGLSGVEGLIILGGPRSAPPADPALVRDALAAEVPVLALGSGVRLLAEGAGAAPYSGPRLPADDDRTVELTPAARTDPVFAGAGRPSPGLRPAADPLELPAGAVVLASCDGYPEQAFRIGASTWGVRFLPQDETAPALGPWGEELLGRFAALVTARAEHTATRAFFTRRADAWEERFAYQTPAYESAVSRMRLAPGRRAVDLGCGTGRAMPALRAQVGPAGQVLGIDVTPAMLTAAARHGRTGHGHLLAADCTRLPLPGASVDGIFSAGLLDHLPDPHTALREWARVTAPDGVLLLFHPSGRAERAARHGRPVDPSDLLAEHNLRPALESTGWHLEAYEDTPTHFLTRAVHS